MSYSNNYYSDSCDPVKQKNYIGYSLQKTFYSERNDGHLCSFGVTPSGDTSDISQFIRVEGKHSFESWSRQEIRSDEYQYSMSDTISKRQGYTINYATYRLSEEQFYRRLKPTRKNRVTRSGQEVYDSLGRIIVKIEETSFNGRRQYHYDYNDQTKKSPSAKRGASFNQ